jgi:putative SOS response-associated peptidase YedK
VPFWAEDISIGDKMINARAETVVTKPSFREGFKKLRFLIPADRFYYWKGRKGEKEPVFIALPNKLPFAFSILLKRRHDSQDPGEAYRLCTNITSASAAP